METDEIQGVEIFSVGTWNGDTYTLDDLKELVDSFESTKSKLPPYLKLGHNEGQELVQADGMPAIGWIKNLYILGEKLVADFSDIPKKIYELISSKAYRKVSAEIYFNLEIAGTKFNKLLSAVALLGADTPAVMNLNDIIAYYKSLGENAPRIYNECIKDIELKIYDRKESMKTELEIKLEEEAAQAKLDLEAKEQELKKFSLDLEAKDKELEALKLFKIEAEKKEIELQAKAKLAKDEAFFTALVSEKLACPSMKENVLQLLGEEKKEYSVKKQDKEISVSKDELLKETLSLFKKAFSVNFEESSEEGNKDAKNSESEKITKINEYAEKNKVSFGAAAKAILKEV